MRRNRLVQAGLVVVVSLVLVGAGRLERSHHADIQNARIAKIVAAIGPLDSSTLDAYRVRPDFDCLIYRRGSNRYALEVCVDPRGRVLEAIDRRHGEPWVGSVREEKSLATNHISRVRVERLLKMMDAHPVGTVPWKF